MKQWFQNRSLLAALLMGGLATIVLLCVMAYGVAWYFMGRSDTANALRWMNCLRLESAIVDSIKTSGAGLICKPGKGSPSLVFAFVSAKRVELP